MTHLFDSYLVLIKFSILDSDGTCPACNLASQYLFALAFPHLRTLCSCSSVQASRSTDLTRLICVPMPRCIPEQRMHTNTPRFQLAHLGCLLRLQSAQTLLPSSLTRAFSVWAFCAALSAGALALLRFILVVYPYRRLYREESLEGEEVEAFTRIPQIVVVNRQRPILAETVLSKLV